MNAEQIESLKKLVASAKSQLAGFTYTAKGTGEIARHTLNLGADYGKTLESSKLALELTDCAEIARETGIAPELLETARGEVMASLEKSIVAHSRGEQSEDYTKRGLYVSIAPGIKFLTTDGTLEICGMSHAKKVIQPGTYKTVKSAPLTIAKNELRGRLPVAKFRTFALDAGAIHSARLQGEEIVFD